jgi:hypothetical protein
MMLFMTHGGRLAGGAAGNDTMGSVRNVKFNKINQPLLINLPIDKGRYNCHESSSENTHPLTPPSDINLTLCIEDTLAVENVFFQYNQIGPNLILAAHPDRFPLHKFYGPGLKEKFRRQGQVPFHFLLLLWKNELSTFRLQM